MHGTPSVQRDLLGRRGKLAACVIDQNVDRAEAFEGAVDEVVDVCGLPHVGGHGQARAATSLDLVADRFKRRAAAATDRDAGTGAGELQGGGPSNAGASSRHQGNGARVRVCSQRGAKGLSVHRIASMWHSPLQYILNSRYSQS